MGAVPDTLASAVGVILAMGALGTAAFGLVDASKIAWGGVSRIGFGYIAQMLAPFKPALDKGSPAWRDTLFANWLNGVAKEDQKDAARNLIRLGLSSANAAHLAKAGHVDPAAFLRVVTNLETGAANTPQDLQVVGRFNAVVDTALDAAFERADQAYRNASKLLAGVVAMALSVWAGYLLYVPAPLVPHAAAPYFITSPLFGWSVLVGLLAVPIAPIAKDLASSLQAAGQAVGAAR